jgi:Xaa-Pro aminopeptidase
MEPAAPIDRAFLAGLLDQEGLDALLVCRPWDLSTQPNVSYLVGHLTPPWDYSGLFVLLPREGALAVVANEWCRDDPSGTFALHRYPGHHMRFALPVLAALLGERGLATARLGIEGTRLPVGLFDDLRAALPGATLAAGDRVLARLRMRKSTAEVALIRRAIAAAEEGVRVALTALAPGRPLAAIEAAVGAVVHPEGGRVISAHFTSYRADGSEALALPSALEQEAVVVLDVIAECGGYRADLARPLACGPVAPEAEERLARVVALQAAMVGAVQAGQAVEAAYAAVTRAAAPWVGDNPSFVFQVHGIGRETHEPVRFCSTNKPFFPLPRAGEADDVPVEAGLVACVELGVGGAWIEDMFRLDDGGPERLTTLPQCSLTPDVVC